MFILISPTLIQCHMFHSSVLPLLICNIPLWQWETWLSSPYIHFLICSIPVYMCNAFKIINSYLYGKWVYQLEYIVYVQFLWSIVLKSTYFQNYLHLWFLSPKFCNFSIYISCIHFVRFIFNYFFFFFFESCYCVVHCFIFKFWIVTFIAGI